MVFLSYLSPSDLLDAYLAQGDTLEYMRRVLVFSYNQKKTNPYFPFLLDVTDIIFNTFKFFYYWTFSFNYYPVKTPIKKLLFGD